MPGEGSVQSEQPEEGDVCGWSAPSIPDTCFDTCEYSSAADPRPGHVAAICFCCFFVFRLNSCCVCRIRYTVPLLDSCFSSDVTQSVKKIHILRRIFSGNHFIERLGFVSSPWCHTEMTRLDSANWAQCDSKMALCTPTIF